MKNFYQIPETIQEAFDNISEMRQIKDNRELRISQQRKFSKGLWSGRKQADYRNEVKGFVISLSGNDCDAMEEIYQGWGYETRSLGNGVVEVIE